MEVKVAFMGTQTQDSFSVIPELISMSDFRAFGIQQSLSNKEIED